MFVSTVFWFCLEKLECLNGMCLLIVLQKFQKKKQRRLLSFLFCPHKHIPSKIPKQKTTEQKNREGFHLSNSFFSLSLNSWGCLDILAAHLVIRSAWPMDWVGLAGHTLPTQYAERRPRATRAMAGLVEPPKGSEPPSCSLQLKANRMEILLDCVVMDESIHS